MTTETDWAEKIGAPAYGNIAEMVAALNCDYDRLEELRDEQSDYEPTEVPDDFPVAELDEDDEAGDRVTCGACGRSWDDAIPTSYTPAPSARCPFEAFHSAATWEEENPEDAEELKELEEAAGECKDQDEARQRIEEDALSVEVRSGWVSPGEEKLTPEDFAILLCTGGPAVRIRGELDESAEPYRAWLEVQDWGKPWTQYFPADQDTLLTYARCFCFGS